MTRFKKSTKRSSTKSSNKTKPISKQKSLTFQDEVKAYHTLLSTNLFYVSIYSFFFVGLFSLLVTTEISLRYTSKHTTPRAHMVLASEIDRTIYPQLKPSEYLSFPFISAQGALIVDSKSQKYLFQKNTTDRLLPASTVKMMTALIALEEFNHDDIVEVGLVTIEGQKMGLTTGEKITVRDLITGLLVYSANDAAEVLASHYTGGRDEFVKRMNQKAQELSLNDTNFTNPSGLDGVNQYTTVTDLSKLALYALENPNFSQIVQTKHVVIKSVDERFTHVLTSTNQLLGEVDGVTGVKTGWTESARENLVTSFNKDGRELIIVLLGSQDRFGETKELITWVLENYEWNNPLSMTH